MNQFHSSSLGQSIKKHRYTMGYKSSQTIAAISWKTLHRYKKNILHWRISASRTNAESIHMMAQTNTAEVTKVL